MKKYYRFMSNHEFEMLMAGQFIEDLKTWEGCRDTSRGVCFLLKGDGVVFCPSNGDEKTFEGLDAIDLYWICLDGIVSSDILVEFESVEDVDLPIGVGRYAANNEHLYIGDVDGGCKCFLTQRYISGGYDASIMKPVRYQVNPTDWDVEPEWVSCSVDQSV